MNRIQHALVALAFAASPILLVPNAAAAGVTGPAFYVDGELYRTVGTPAILPEGPAFSHDVIYAFGDFQGHNVAVAAPGDTDYNGGRWEVHGLGFDDFAGALAEFDLNDSGDFDSAYEVHAALDAGAAWDVGILVRFECPVIPLPQGR